MRAADAETAKALTMDQDFGRGSGLEQVSGLFAYLIRPSAFMALCTAGRAPMRA